MKILITGATGTIGRSLCMQLLNNGYVVTALTRNKKNAAEIIHARTQIIEWDPGKINDYGWTGQCGNIDVVINLAGESINAKRWSNAQKKRILDSRITATRIIVNAVKEKKIEPHTLLNASAIGYYDFHPERKFTEEDCAGKGFLSKVCEQWEAEACKAEQHGTRIVRLRTGIVLSALGGTLKQMLLPFKMYLGGCFGDGSQWFSWVHIDDFTRAILFILENDTIHGPVNIVSPNPATNKEFVRAVGSALRKPAFLSIPRFVIWLRYGELANLLYKSQKVVPQRLLESGFKFLHTDIKEAVERLIFRQGRINPSRVSRESLRRTPPAS